MILAALDGNAGYARRTELALVTLKSYFLPRRNEGSLPPQYSRSLQLHLGLFAKQIRSTICA